MEGPQARHKDHRKAIMRSCLAMTSVWACGCVGDSCIQILATQYSGEESIFRTQRLHLRTSWKTFLPSQ
ncbi:hypothetical protein E2C01_031792 [Portunus trituberculatus]|uniref:Uncharacterized protein n=1 Tax=Portunus trituberculatus TaxID=210409 RepID=A0A5B7EYS9_PORTR|nr:hypothetical protein [Portunus trituberculatus]